MVMMTVQLTPLEMDVIDDVRAVRIAETAVVVSTVPLYADAGNAERVSDDGEQMSEFAIEPALQVDVQLQGVHDEALVDE